MTAVTLELDDRTIQTMRSLSQYRESDLPGIVSELLQNALYYQQNSEKGGTTEIDLVMQARQEIPADSWRRFRLLTKKRRDETLTTDEFTELLALGDTLETHHAQRVEAAAQLARIWRRDLKEVMRILGVRSRHV